MSNRALDTGFASALAAGTLIPAIFCMLTFKSATRYVWSGLGEMLFNGQTYVGVGSLGSVGAVSEGVEVKADGTTITLSGVDPLWLSESLTDIRLGAPAKIWIALLTPRMTIAGSYLLFAGTVDKPLVTVQGETVSISLALENRLVNLSRASNARYTSADQRRAYQDDTAFDSVEILSDHALKWGQ